MKTIFRVFIPLLTLTMLLVGYQVVRSQCGPNGCSPTQFGGYSQFQIPNNNHYLWNQSYYIVPNTGYSWKVHQDNSDEYTLYKDGKYLGNYNTSLGTFWYRVGNTWLEDKVPYPISEEMSAKVGKYQENSKKKDKLVPDTTPKDTTPVPAPSTATDAQVVQPNSVPSDKVDMLDGTTVPTGVDRSKLSMIPDVHYHTIDGKRVTREEAIQTLIAVGREGIPDYSTRLHLTAIGDKTFRDKVRTDFIHSSLKDTTLFHDYDPTDPKESWILDCGFKKDGQQLYLQSATGEVLARTEKYEGIETLRKIDPNYKPDNDPDPTKPKTPPTPTPGPNKPDTSPNGGFDWVKFFNNIPPWVIMIVVGLGVYVLNKD